MSCYTKEQIEKAVKSKEFSWFENGDLNLNDENIEEDAELDQSIDVFANEEDQIAHKQQRSH